MPAWPFYSGMFIFRPTVLLYCFGITRKRRNLRLSENISGKRIINWVAAPLCAVAAAIVLLMVGHVLIYATSRLLKLFSLLGTIEIIANYYMVAIVFLPIACLISERDQELISVTFFTQKMREKPLRVVLRIGQFLTLAFFSVLAVGACRKFLDSWHDQEVINIASGFIALWPSRLVVAAGLVGGIFATLWLICTFSSRRDLVRSKTHESYD